MMRVLPDQDDYWLLRSTAMTLFVSKVAGQLFGFK